jgi:hypothetical protein
MNGGNLGYPALFLAAGQRIRNSRIRKTPPPPPDSAPAPGRLLEAHKNFPQLVGCNDSARGEGRTRVVRTHYTLIRGTCDPSPKLNGKPVIIELHYPAHKTSFGGERLWNCAAISIRPVGLRPVAHAVQSSHNQPHYEMAVESLSNVNC